MEFGAKDDFQLIQALNHFKGLPVKLSKVEPKTATNETIGEIKSDGKSVEKPLEKPMEKPAGKPETKPAAKPAAKSEPAKPAVDQPAAK